jgi:hypothetical protein
MRSKLKRNSKHEIRNPKMTSQVRFLVRISDFDFRISYDSLLVLWPIMYVA